MAVEIINGERHTYAPNPKLEGQDWNAEYPPLSDKTPYLINKFTGEIIPNLEEYRRRSDILSNYVGEDATTDNLPKEVVKASAFSGEQQPPTIGELEAL